MSIPESNSFFETTEESNNLINYNSHDFEQRDSIHKHPLHMNQSNNSLMNNMQSHSQPSSTLNLSQGIYIPNSSNPQSINNNQMMNMHENINKNYVQSKSKVNIPQINSLNTLNDDIFPNMANYGNLSDNRDYHTSSMSTNMSLFNRMPNNASTNQLNHTNSYNSLNSMFTPSNTNLISHDLQELTNQLSYLNEKISTKDKQIKDLTDRIVKLETQNHILKDEIKIIKDGNVACNPNPSNPNLANINVNRHIINSNGSHGHIANPTPSSRLDLNDEMVLSPDMGNYALAEQASAQKSIELDYSLNL